MRRFFTFLIIFMPFLEAPAVDLSLQIEATSTPNIVWSRIDKHRHSADCYPIKKKDERSELPAEVVSRNISVNDVRSSTSLGVISGNHAVNFGNINFELSRRSNDEGSDIYSFQMVDNLNWSSSRNLGGSKCNIKEYHWRIDSHRIQGFYNLNIQMPQDSWILMITINNNGQAAPIASVKTKGDFHGVALRRKEPFYVWAKPGSIIQIPIPFDILSTKGMQGQMEITIKRPGLHGGMDPLKSLSQAKNDLLAKKNSAKGFINAGASIAGHPEVAKSIVNSMGLTSIQNLTDELYNLAQGELSNNPNELHIKAMAAAVGYELALAVLDNLKVFCETKSIYLPLSNITVNRPGFIIANFWMNQNIQRINELHFPEIKTYLNEIVAWENKGLKYSDIASNRQEFKKLSDGFVKIRQHSRLAWDVYAEIKLSLKRITSVFGTAGTDPQTLELLYQRLDQISEQRRQVNREFQNFVLGFVVTNQSPIAASAVLSQIIALEKSNEELVERMGNTLKFVSIGDDGSENTVLKVMTGFLAHQVNIFDLPLSSKFLEPIRMSFHQSAQVETLKASYNKCLGGE